ncbi:hypothetical protein HELRODRAFT_165434 [Helobdella robusta]|uniref:Uncharacterized protein n=1 Tax=Helobdella robusta TaxID=6412 RepID=T1EWS4_HELRO|nr:hypothetical protein HELRODRAFT_165434 [Helobdella robusta]ESN91404.1 hypothetical protein HELRODRAFT_165434 [Helobdella robusta]
MKLNYKHALFGLVLLSIGFTTFVFFFKGYSDAFFSQYYNKSKVYGNYKNGFRINKNSSTKKWVVITSIFKPTDAIGVFSKMSGWQLLVRSSMNFANTWVFRPALNFVSDGEVAREGGRAPGKRANKANADLAKECLAKKCLTQVASAREQDMKIYEKRKGHEQLDEQQS